MAGGTLMVSRAVNLFPYWKKELETFGFKDVSFTDQEKDGLNSVIRKINPGILIIGCGFYRNSTPYMMRQLLNDFPKLNIAAVNIHEYPDDLAMCFITNGVKSYVNMMDGMEEFYRGMKAVSDGKNYVSPVVLDRINIRKEYPMPAAKITNRQEEVIRLLCSGFKEEEIADTLHISRRTVVTHKTDIFRALNVRNSYELFRAAQNLNIVNPDEIYFYPKDMTVFPLPEKAKKASGNYAA